MQILHHNVP